MSQSMINEVERERRLRKLFISCSRKYADMIEDPAGLDEIKQRRRTHRMWVHLIIIRKMYARSVERLYQYAKQASRKIERSRKIWEDDDFKQKEYETWTKTLDELKEVRRENGRWLLEIGYYLQSFKMSLSATEMQVALSIPSGDWERCIGQEKKRDIPFVAFVMNLGDEILIDQVIAAAQWEFIHNAKLREQMKWKSMSLFPELF